MEIMSYTIPGSKNATEDKDLITELESIKGDENEIYERFLHRA